MELTRLGRIDRLEVAHRLALVIVQGQIDPGDPNARNVRDNVMQSRQVEGRTTHAGKTHHATVVGRTPGNEATGQTITQQVGRVSVTVQTGAAIPFAEPRGGDRHPNPLIQLLKPEIDLGAAERIQELDAVAVDDVVIDVPVFRIGHHLELGEVEQGRADRLELFAHVGARLVVRVQGPLHHFSHGRGTHRGGCLDDGLRLSGNLLTKARRDLIEVGEGIEPGRALPQVTQALNGRSREGGLDSLVLTLKARDGLEQCALLGKVGHPAQFVRCPGERQKVDQGFVADNPIYRHHGAMTSHRKILPGHRSLARSPQSPRPARKRCRGMSWTGRSASHAGRGTSRPGPPHKRICRPWAHPANRPCAPGAQADRCFVG
ncbi:hypothetical protein D3C78_984270 [compost metagenome]